MAELYWAVKHFPCPEILNALISAGGNINYQYQYRNTLLHFVNDSIIAKDLISFGLDVNTPNNLGYTPLDVASQEERDVDVVKTLISAGGNFKNKDFNTLVHLIKNYPTLVEDFISLGFDVNMTNDEGQAPLHYILEKYRCEDCRVIKLLTKQMADVNLNDKKGNTPMSIAINQNLTIDVVKALISVGGDINCRDSERNTLVHHYPTLASELISLGLDVNLTNKDGESPLHYLLKNCCPSKIKECSEMVQLLIKNKANINATDNEGSTPLDWAIKNVDCTNIVESLISVGGKLGTKNLYTFLQVILKRPTLVKDYILQGFDVNMTNDEGETPLHCLLRGHIFEKYSRVIKELLHHKVDVNLKDLKGNTPMSLAIKKKVSCEIMNALILAGGDIHCRDSNGNTLLHLYPSLVSELISLGLGSDVNMTNDMGQTPFHCIMEEFRYRRNRSEKYFGAMKELIHHKADVNYREKKMSLAIKNDVTIDVVNALISAGWDIHCRDSNGNTLLHLYPSFASELISLGIGVNSINNGGETPLHCLLKNSELNNSKKYFDEVQVLIQNHADVQASDNSGYTVLDWAIIQQKGTDIVKYLMSVGGKLKTRNFNKFSNLIETYPTLVEDFISLGFDVNAPNNLGYTPLDVASQEERDVDVVKTLISAGGNFKNKDFNTLVHLIKNYPTLVEDFISLGFDVNMTNNMGQAPLHYILKKYRCEDCRVIKLLTKHMADVNLKDKKGNTPMSIAINQKVTIDVVKALISAGGDINCRDSERNTLLHHYPTLASELISLGLDVNLINNIRGCTPLGWAIKHKLSCNIMKALISAGADINYRDSKGNTLLHMPEYYSLAKDIISLGFDVNTTNSNNQTPLEKLIKHLSLKFFTNVHCEFFYLLISNGAKLSLTNYSPDFSPDFSLDKELRLIIFEHYYNNKQLNLIRLRNVNIIGVYKRNTFFKYFTKCVKEIVRMKFHMIHTHLSLFDFIKSKRIPKLIFTFRDVNINTFPEYFDLIKFKISVYSRKIKLLYDLKWVQVAPSEGNKEVFLDYYSLCYIIEYLPDVDLSNFMKAIFVVDSATDS